MFSTLSRRTARGHTAPLPSHPHSSLTLVPPSSADQTIARARRLVHTIVLRSDFRPPRLPPPPNFKTIAKQNLDHPNPGANPTLPPWLPPSPPAPPPHLRGCCSSARPRTAPSPRGGCRRSRRGPPPPTPTRSSPTLASCAAASRSPALAPTKPRAAPRRPRPPQARVPPAPPPRQPPPRTRSSSASPTTACRSRASSRLRSLGTRASSPSSSPTRTYLILPHATRPSHSRGLIASTRFADSCPAFVRRKLGLLAGGDVFCLLLFSAIGRFSHGLPVLDAETFKTADPFIAG